MKFYESILNALRARFGDAEMTEAEVDAKLREESAPASPEIKASVEDASNLRADLDASIARIQSLTASLETLSTSVEALSTALGEMKTRLEVVEKTPAAETTKADTPPVAQSDASSRIAVPEASAFVLRKRMPGLK